MTGDMKRRPEAPPCPHESTKVMMGLCRSCLAAHIIDLQDAGLAQETGPMIALLHNREVNDEDDGFRSPVLDHVPRRVYAPAPREHPSHHLPSARQRRFQRDHHR